MRTISVENDVRRRYNRRVLFSIRIKGAAFLIGLWDLMIHSLLLCALLYVFIRMPQEQAPPAPSHAVIASNQIYLQGNQDGILNNNNNGVGFPSNNLLLNKIMENKARSLQAAEDSKELYSNIDYVTYKWSRSLSSQDKCIVYFVTLSSTAVIIAMLWGVAKNKPSYIVPYFLIKVFNVIVSVLSMLGFYAYLPDISMWIRMQPAFPFKENLLELDAQTLQLVLFAFLLFVVLAKLWIAAVIWYAYGYITALNVARSIGTVTTDSPVMPEFYSPPKYEEAIKQEQYYATVPPPAYTPLLTS